MSCFWRGVVCVCMRTYMHMYVKVGGERWICMGLTKINNNSITEIKNKDNYLVVSCLL